jgi:hypothetical protein
MAGAQVFQRKSLNPRRRRSSWLPLAFPGNASLALTIVLTALSLPQPGFAWGREGRQVIALVAEHYMTATAKAKTSRQRGLFLSGCGAGGLLLPLPANRRSLCLVLP